MSQTVINRPSQLKTKEVKPQLKLDTYSATNSTKGSPGMTSLSGSSVGENRFSIGTEGPEEYTSQDLAEIGIAGQELSHEIVHKVDYEVDMAKKRQFLEKTMASKLPLAIKIKMLESTMEGLKTNVYCVKETNQILKEKILNIEKNNIQKQAAATSSKETTPSKSNILASSSASKTGIGRNIPQSKVTTGLASKTAVNATKSQPPQSEAERLYEEALQENNRLEETIAQLKQTRNYLTVEIEDKKDDIEDMQAKLKEKKDSLDRKSFYAEDLKQRISKKSVKRSTSTSGSTAAPGHKKTHSALGIFSLGTKNGSKTNLDKTQDLSSSRIDTSVLQEMSSKIGNVFGKVGRVFGKKKTDGAIDQILNTEFLRELDNQSTPASLNNSMVQQPSHRGGGMNLSMSNFHFK